MMSKSFDNPEKKAILRNLYDDSCSCAKRSHKRWWDVRTDVRHCGKCLPCIYRRVALDAVSLDNSSKLGTNIFDSPRFDVSNNLQQSSSDVRSLLYFLRYRCDVDTISQELRLNGITNETELHEYIELALNSYNQVKEWINEKGTNTIKNLAGL